MLIFENGIDRTVHTRYLLKLEKKDYNVMIDDRNCFDQIIRNNIIIYESIKKVFINQGNDYLIGCLLGYPYFKENYKLLVIDLSKHAIDADTKTIQQIHFSDNPDLKANRFFT